MFLTIAAYLITSTRTVLGKKTYWFEVQDYKICLVLFFNEYICVYVFQLHDPKAVCIRNREML